MAITIIKNFTSNKFYPSANPINCTVDSNNSGKCNFRYICDLYVNGIKLNTQKLFPDPKTGYGFFQLSRIIQDYIETSLPKTPYTHIINAGASLTNPSSGLSVFCRFGEEYDNSTDCNGTIIQYNNLQTSNTFYVFESAIEYEDWPSFDSSKYVVATSSTSKMFLTNTHKEIEVTYNDSYFLDFLSLQTINASYSCVVKTYNSSSSLIATKTYTRTLPAHRRYRLAVGPYDINKYDVDTTISSLVSYYTVQLNWSGSQISELVTFKVREPKPFRTRIAFVGLLGTPEQFTFYHRNRKGYTIERQNFQKLLQSNYSNEWTYQVGDRTTKTYGVIAKEGHSVSTYCDKKTSEWLYEMWISPNVFTFIRPDLINFHTFLEGTDTWFWLPDGHDILVGDNVFIFSDNTNLTGRVSVSSVDGNKVRVGSFTSEVGCGWIQKDTNWKTLPIMISDNEVEVKTRTSRPIEYSLTYESAYPKNTLR